MKAIITALAAGIIAFLLIPVSVLADTDANQTPVVRRSTRRKPLPYLGVYATPVPPEVAKQIGLESGGAMIRNVVKDSAADKAGLEQYDVIVKMGNGESVAVKGAEEFITTLKTSKVGDVMNLELIRGGKRRLIEVTLGARPPVSQLKYKYEEEPKDRVEEELRLSRGVLRKRGGKWVLEGVVGGPIELPGNVFRAMPGQASALRRMMVQSKSGDGPTEFREASGYDAAGGKLTVKNRDDEKIDVIRKAPDGTTETKTYDYVAQLRHKAPQAYDLYRRAVELRMRTSRAKKAKDTTSPPGIGDDVAETAEKWQKELQEEIRKLADRLEAEADDARQAVAQAMAPVTRKFDVDDQGRIRVQIRTGNYELNITFDNEAEMKKKSPGLYQEYKKVLEGR